MMISGSAPTVRHPRTNPNKAAVINRYIFGVLNAFVGAAAILLTLPELAQAQDTHAPSQPARIRYVTSVKQVGPVAYRDPLGSISPDGKWIAYTNDRTIGLIPSSGGPIRTLGPGENDLRQLSWMPSSRSIAVLERTFDRSESRWYVYDIQSGERALLWGDGGPAGLLEIAWTENEQPAEPAEAAGILRRNGQSYLVLLDAESGAVTDTLASSPKLSFPVWMPADSATYSVSKGPVRNVACLHLYDGGQELQMPCGTESPSWARQIYGAYAYSHDGTTLFFATPNERNRLDVWLRNLATGESRQLSSFDRDGYAPSTASDGTILFKSQDYDLRIAMVDSRGGESIPVTTFLSETPMWDWSGTRLSFTWGDWRRQTDDLYYPEISQHIGYIDLGAGLPASTPSVIVRQSDAEDQSMHWSPNGKWIVFHTHVNGDDVWLKPADNSRPGWQITYGGSETGWPRWSPDGKWIQYPSYRYQSDGSRRSDIFVLGIDQDTGEITTPATPVDLGTFAFDAQQGEWLGGSDEIVFESASGPGKKSIFRVPRTGGQPQLIHNFSSPQVFSGISASPDGKWIVFVAPTPARWIQVQRVPSSGGIAEPITYDATNKTQPAYSPDGTRVAFTVFSYQVHFWAIDP